MSPEAPKIAPDETEALAAKAPPPSKADADRKPGKGELDDSDLDAVSGGTSNAVTSAG